MKEAATDGVNVGGIDGLWLGAVVITVGCTVVDAVGVSDGT